MTLRIGVVRFAPNPEATKTIQAEGFAIDLALF